MGAPSNHRDLDLDLDLESKLIARAESDRARIVQSDIDWMVAHR